MYLDNGNYKWLKIAVLKSKIGFKIGVLNGGDVLISIPFRLGLIGYNAKQIPFRLGLIGYNAKQTDEGLRQFIDNNEEQIARVNWSARQIYLRDGSTIRGVQSVDDRRLAGMKFDQLILFDDERWNIKWHREEDIRIIKAVSMNFSIVPEEFQLIEYENIG